MKLQKILTGLTLAGVLFLSACAPKDADIQKAVKAKEAEQITVAVDKGVVTLGGDVADEAAKTNAEDIAKKEKGVKSVVNNIQISMVDKAVQIATDPVLTSNVKDAVKDYPTVTASVNYGVVTLTGEIKQSELIKLMQQLSALKPKKIDNQLTVK